MDNLRKWGKELQEAIRYTIKQNLIRQDIVNEFLYNKLSLVDQAELMSKIKAHDMQTKEERDAIKRAEFDEQMEELKNLTKKVKP